jgi:tetratricopeptide (TPR) repeat protein
LLSTHRLSGDSFEFKITRKKAFVFFLLSGAIIGLFANIFLAESYNKKNMYETASRLNPIDAKNYYLQSKISANVEDKIKLLNRCVKLNPEKYQYYQNLAAAYLDLAKADRRHIIRAIANYKTVLDKNPYNTPVYFFMGNIFYNMKEYRKARQYFIKANSVEPNFVQSLISAARCSRLLKEKDRAGIEYRRATKLKQKLRFYPGPESNYEKFLIQ